MRNYDSQRLRLRQYRRPACFARNLTRRGTPGPICSSGQAKPRQGERFFAVIAENRHHEYGASWRRSRRQSVRSQHTETDVAHALVDGFQEAHMDLRQRSAETSS